MPSLKRLIEWRLGLDEAGSGRGTDWSLDFGTSAGSPYSTETLLALGAGLLALAAIVYRREAARLPRGRRIALVLLRGLAGLLLVAMLGRAALRVDRTALPTVAVLIDVSGSMGLEDEYAARPAARSARALSRAAGSEKQTRLSLAQGLLTEDDEAWLRTIEQRRQTHLYVFDEHLRSLEQDAATDSSGTSADRATKLRELTATSNRTAPATALRELFEAQRGASLAAVVILTDGAATAGEDERLSAAADLARDRGVPLYPIAVGSDQPARDVELYDPLSEEIVYVGDPATVSFRVRSFGYAGEEATLRLLAAGEEEPLAETKVTLAADGTSFTADLTFVPEAEGVYDLTAVAPPRPGESNADNNAVRQRIVVRRDRFRVLLVEGAPRWEYRALKPALERDDTIQVDTFLQEADLNFAPEDRTALSSFPATQEQLNAYDVVIWGDVDLAALPGDVGERLAKFVGERGGGLILIAGERHNPIEYEHTPLEDLLPVYPAEARRPQNGEDDVAGLPPFRLERTPEGRAWPFLRLHADRTADEAIWQSLPARMHWLMISPQRKPGAQTLAVHPALLSTGMESPAIVHQRFGRGQTLYHATDELWTWRLGVEDLYYGRYWSQAVRGMAPPRRSAEPSAGELTTDRKVYEPGDDIRIRYRRPAGGIDGSLAPGIVAEVESSGGAREMVQLAPRASAPELYEGKVSALPLGDYRVSVAPEGANEPGASALFRIEAPEREFRERIVQTADLQRAASLTHGSYTPFWEAEEVPRKLPAGRAVRLSESEPIPLWNRWEVMCAFAALLTAEWLLRKRSRLV